MKKIKLLIGIIGLIAALSCEGPPGPPGLDGIDAPRSEVYEQSVSFTYDPVDNVWNSDIVSFNNALSGDVYLGFVSLGDDIFTSLPASFFDEFGEFQYVYDHDFESVQFQIIGDNDLSNLSLDFTTNVITRIAIIPADLFAESNLDADIDMTSLMEQINLVETDIISQ